MVLTHYSTLHIALLSLFCATTLSLVRGVVVWVVLLQAVILKSYTRTPSLPPSSPPVLASRGMIQRISSPAAGRGQEAEWHADILRERISAISRAVEKKGGWRSVVFLDDDKATVDVDVDVAPWPAEDGLLMLQAVKNALVMQLEEVKYIGYKSS